MQVDLICWQFCEGACKWRAVCAIGHKLSENLSPKIVSPLLVYVRETILLPLQSWQSQLHTDRICNTEQNGEFQSFRCMFRTSHICFSGVLSDIGVNLTLDALLI